MRDPASPPNFEDGFADSSAAARARLVDHLMLEGAARSPEVVRALRAVPRHLFFHRFYRRAGSGGPAGEGWERVDVPPGPLPPDLVAQLYADEAIPVRIDAEGRASSSSSQPAIVALMLEDLDLRPGFRVLEIGTGTGWNAAMVAAIVGPSGRVWTLDNQADLVEEARIQMARLARSPASVTPTTRHSEGAPPGAGPPARRASSHEDPRVAPAGMNGRAGAAAPTSTEPSGAHRAGLQAPVTALVGDGAAGLPAHAPFDRLVATAAVPDLLPAWMSQLRPGGLFLAPFHVPGLGDPLLRLRRCRADGGPLAFGRFTRWSGFMGLRDAAGDLQGEAESEPPPVLSLPCRDRPGPWGDSPAASPWHRFDRRSAFQLFLQIADPHAQAVTPPGESWLGTGLIEPDGSSAVLIGPNGLQVFGTDTAADRLDGLYRRWLNLGAPSLTCYRVLAWPAGKEPASTLALRRPHVTLTFALA